MRFFSGLSAGGRHLRAGISSTGRLWLGARAGKGPAYVGVRSGSHPFTAIRRRDQRGRPILAFTVEDDGRVFLGDTELDVEDLREVIRASDEARNREEKKS